MPSRQAGDRGRGVLALRLVVTTAAAVSVGDGDGGDVMRKTVVSIVAIVRWKKPVGHTEISSINCRGKIQP